MRICGIQGVSLIDFPGRIASVFFLAGCNFRCPFCQNQSLVEERLFPARISEDEALECLKRKNHLIDGVEITGGEPLANSEGLIEFLEKVKGMGLYVKIDTNGYEERKLEEMLKRGIVDYVAMDIKTSFKKYDLAAGRKVNIDRIANSIRIIMEKSIDYEFRTTCVPGIVTLDDIEEISYSIKGAKRYYLQQFRNDRPTLDPSCMRLEAYSKEQMERFLEVARTYVAAAGIRGV
jgi:pyruvate formate lyase activating enzyme